MSAASSEVLSAPSGTQSVCRALDLLIALGGARPDLSVTELACSTGLHASTVSRLLGALQAYHFVTQDPQTQRFRLGPRCFQLGQVFLSRVEIVGMAEPVMRELTARLGLSTHLAVLSDNRVVRLKHVEPEGYVLRLSPAERYALGEVHCEAMGKVLVAFQTDSRVAEILDSIAFPRYTPKTITSKDEMLREIERIRDAGFAVDRGERYEDVRCVAVPIWDHTDSTIAAMSISGTAKQLSRARIAELAKVMMEAAQRLSRQLGGSIRSRPREGRDESARSESDRPSNGSGEAAG